MSSEHEQVAAAPRELADADLSGVAGGVEAFCGTVPHPNPGPFPPWPRHRHHGPFPHRPRLPHFPTLPGPLGPIIPL